VRGTGNTSWAHRYQLPCALALTLRGRHDEATTAFEAITARRYPSWRFLDYELAIAKAWSKALRSAISEATNTVLAAADTCRENGQLAAEVLCLQTATQFGHRGCAPRLRELASVVTGPRAGVAARFAAALARSDGAELSWVATQFEAMGDVVAAVDAAARPRGERVSARRPAWFGTRMLGIRRRTRRPMRRRAHAGPDVRGRAATVH
jgi:hypothetical protein